ncbi:hypothetical protein [Sphingomonas sp.]|uniref:hypothetical protein n=1 Tax=Sphingomonas sp. TaxID=28214 RepID=UPI003CC67073
MQRIIVDFSQLDSIDLLALPHAPMGQMKAPHPLGGTEAEALVLALKAAAAVSNVGKQFNNFLAQRHAPPTLEIIAPAKTPIAGAAPSMRTTVADHTEALGINLGWNMIGGASFGSGLYNGRNPLEWGVYGSASMSVTTGIGMSGMVEFTIIFDKPSAMAGLGGSITATVGKMTPMGVNAAIGGGIVYSASPAKVIGLVFTFGISADFVSLPVLTITASLGSTAMLRLG